MNWDLHYPLLWVVGSFAQMHMQLNTFVTHDVSFLSKCKFFEMIGDWTAWWTLITRYQLRSNGASILPLLVCAYCDCSIVLKFLQECTILVELLTLKSKLDLVSFRKNRTLGILWSAMWVCRSLPSKYVNRLHPIKETTLPTRHHTDGTSAYFPMRNLSGNTPSATNGDTLTGQTKHASATCQLQVCMCTVSKLRDLILNNSHWYHI